MELGEKTLEIEINHKSTQMASKPRPLHESAKRANGLLKWAPVCMLSGRRLSATTGTRRRMEARKEAAESILQGSCRAEMEE
ncbi:hypothetical protein QQ045_025919 [Rhodiola kirilowii]